MVMFLEGGGFKSRARLVFSLFFLSFFFGVFVDLAFTRR